MEYLHVFFTCVNIRKYALCILRFLFSEGEKMLSYTPIKEILNFFMTALLIT